MSDPKTIMLNRLVDVNQEEKHLAYTKVHYKTESGFFSGEEQILNMENWYDAMNEYEESLNAFKAALMAYQDALINYETTATEAEEDSDDYHKTT